VDAQFCNELPFGFSWLVEEPATRTSHVLAADGRVWLVDPVAWEPALDRLLSLGRPVAVIQLLDRHNRDCAVVAARLGVPHVMVPDALPGTPFDCIAVRRSRAWRETALWWPETGTLIVAESVGTNRFFTGGRGAAGVHLVLRLKPPRRLAGYEPEHLLVGHGEGVHGQAATSALHAALAESRRGLPRMLVHIPAFAVDAVRRRR
jgi:hypothetical protein